VLRAFAWVALTVDGETITSDNFMIFYKRSARGTDELGNNPKKMIMMPPLLVNKMRKQQFYHVKNFRSWARLGNENSYL
jgi:hypothetical protein